MTPPFTFDNLQADEASKELVRRSVIIQSMAPLIANRLAVAKQRDKLRYLHVFHDLM